jgi:diaminopimelate decarboxylase
VLDRFSGILPITARINDSGRLEVGGVDLVDVAGQYGTPLFVYDEQTIRKQCKTFVGSLSKSCSPGSKVIYASKAFNCTAICQLIDEEGLSIDVSTAGEFLTAKAAGIKGDKIYFHGNNKSKEELEMALQYGVGRIIVDSIDELEFLSAIARNLNKQPEILIRLTPGIKAHTHEFLETGDIDCKFGLGIENGKAFEAIQKAIADKNLELVGVHVHIGSQIFAVHSYGRAIEIVAEFLSHVKKEIGWQAGELNMGGGLGIKYSHADAPSSINELSQVIGKSLKDEFISRSLKIPSVSIEPGRSIVANAGLTLYSVGTIKEVPGVRTYVSIDGGMSDNMRPLLYGSKYEAIVANKADVEPTRTVTIAGKHCEPGDVIIKGALIAPVARGEIIATPATGAYGYAMSNNYNRQPRPGVVLLNNGKVKEIIRRETVDDLLEKDMPLK